ncbi:diacylglycerol kinase family protein [Bacillus salipaludis]|uniref:Diacylglycerol kinase family protein n=1 Tax=Bacillus salipaludis TaxID=2547811 RepID=A0ABW8RDP8_9BACI
MDSQDKSFPFMKTFVFAFTGILTALRMERNMRFHFIASIIVIIGSFSFSITKVEWVFVLFAIGGMFALELMNTAIERVVDLITTEFHPLAKQAKDLAAGAVLVYAILSVVIGIVIFSPYVLKLF